MEIKKSKIITDAEELRRIAEKKWHGSQADSRQSEDGEENQRLIHELGVRQIELEMQNNQLLQARDDLENALERYIDLYDFAPIGYLTLDNIGAVSSVNLNGAKLIGVERSLLIGRQFREFVDIGYRPLFSEFIKKVFAIRNKDFCEVMLASEGNTSMYVHMEATASPDGNECRISMTDITEQKRSYELLRESEEFHRSLFEVLNGFAYCQMHYNDDDEPVDLTYLSVNTAFERHTGLKDVVGKKITEVVPGIRESNPELLNIYGRVAKTGTMERFEVFVPALQNSWLDISVISPKQGYFVAVFDNITDRKQLEKEREEALGRLQKIASSLPGVVYQYRLRPDGSSCYPFASETLREIFSVSPEEVREDASPIHNRIHQDDYDGFVASIRESAQGLSPWRHEARVKHADGTVRWLFGNALPEREAGGSILWHGFMTDITCRIEVQKELLKAKEEAEAANRAKSEFLANMSHEIRTPMNGVIGMTQLLEMTGLNGVQQGYVEAIKFSGNNLLSLIADILDLSKIEANKIDIECAGFSFNRCINNIIESQSAHIRKKGLAIHVDISEDIPPVLMGDQRRVMQILHNLIGNAIKFTQEGDIAIAAQLLERRDTSVLMQIEVRDTGIGIQAGALERIFMPFVQEDGSTTRKFGGTGLGLTISRRLAALMGGTITVESTPGAGSCFTVILPFSMQSGNCFAKTVAPAMPATWDGLPLRILLVEDNEINITYGANLLGMLGQDVVVAENGSECLAELAQGSFDMVLMDIQMPVMDGVEALRAIRGTELGTSRHLPVIAVTAHSLTGERERFLAEGFDGYVSKPLIIDDLIKEMKRHINHV